MTSQVSIYRHEDGVLDPMTGIIVSSHGSLVYTGKARIWYAQSGNIVLLGDADINLMDTYLSIPWAVGIIPHRDDVVVVESCQDDPDLEGAGFRIMNNDGGGLMNATRKFALQTFTDSHTWTSHIKHTDFSVSFTVSTAASGVVS